jgi:TRAP-type mannitol/chloroaromatic compound transport system permease small subunit
MRIIAGAVFLLDALTEYFGRIVSWLVLYMVLVTFANVVLRYVYGLSNVALVETTLYAFAIVLAASPGWTMQRDEHVRVDIFYNMFSSRKRAVVDLLGAAVLLAPVLWVIAERSRPYVMQSWKLREGSNEVAGLDYLYLLKTFLVVFVAVLAVQALSTSLRKISLLLYGQEPKRAFQPGGDAA